MSRILVLVFLVAVSTGVGAAEFSVDLWGVVYVAEKDTDDHTFRLDDNDCRRDVTTMVYADATKGVDNRPAWTQAYLDCMQGKGYALAPRKPDQS
jgi:hypothetical protein